MGFTVKVIQVGIVSRQRPRFKRATVANGLFDGGQKPPFILQAFSQYGISQPFPQVIFDILEMSAVAVAGIFQIKLIGKLGHGAGN